MLNSVQTISNLPPQSPMPKRKSVFFRRISLPFFLPSRSASLLQTTTWVDFQQTQSCPLLRTEGRPGYCYAIVLNLFQEEHILQIG